MFRNHHRDRASSKDSSNSNGVNNDFYPNPGINNLGNSCFLNSVIQGLAASRPLRDALAAYPGAERALKASHGAGQGVQGAGTTTHSNAADDPAVNKADTAEIDRIAEVANDQRQGATTTTPAPTANLLPPGTPTTETSPSLQLLTENPFPDSLPLSSALASTLVKLWSGKQSTISVKSLMRELNRKNEDWNEWDQMDAHELLRFLLDGISMEEMDLIKKRDPQSAPKPKKQKKKRKGIAEQLRRKAADGAGEAISSSDSESSASDDDDLSTSEAESLLAEDPTYRLPPHAPTERRSVPFIDTIFGGKLASVIVCEECRGVSRIEEDFLDISLPIKGDDGKVRRRDRLRKFLGSSSSNLQEKQERPRLAPRAPTAILNPSETETSDSDGGAALTRERQLSSNASISSGAATSSSGKARLAGDSALASSREDMRYESDVSVQRRKTLDSHSMRPESPRRNFLGVREGARSRDASPSRRSSVRLGASKGDASVTSGEATSKASRDVNGRKRSKATSLLAKPTKEQQDYIRKLFAEIPSPTTATSNPLAHLRVAQPGGSQHATTGTPTPSETNGSQLAQADAVNTGLYNCLVQFTSVELLDGDNAFQCRRCWKLLHPDLVAQVGRRRAAKIVQRKEAAENARLAQSNHAQSIHTIRDDTPRASISAGSDGPVRGDNMIATNRKLLAERERQLSASKGTAHPRSSLSESIGSATLDSAAPGKTAPEIMVTANSPPISPPGTSEGSTDHTLSNFSQLGVSESRKSNGSASTHGSQASSGMSMSSDLGAEADEDDRSDDVSDVDNGTFDGPNTSVKSVRGANVHGKDVSGSPVPPLQVLPSLPPRSQRFLPRRAHKRYLISSLPPILVLHLKRFQQMHKSLFSSFGDLKKLDDKVTFPLYLDMAPFMAPPPLEPKDSSLMEKVISGERSSNGEDTDTSKRGRDTHGAEQQKSSWFRKSSPTAQMQSNCIYRLYGVIVHKGSMMGGHYVAFTYASQKKHELSQGKSLEKGNPNDGFTKSDRETARQWTYFSDDVVRPASVDEVVKSQAYLLLYERVDASQRQ